jgi:hypothetical protein
LLAGALTEPEYELLVAAVFSESPSLAPVTAEGVHSAVIQAAEPAH